VSELLTDEARIAIELAFGVPLINQFVSTEGLVGHSEPGDAALSFATDMCIVELVDDENRPTLPGQTSAKVLITNLHNHTQPLIRSSSRTASSATHPARTIPTCAPRSTDGPTMGSTTGTSPLTLWSSGP
jgi:phenylacetate-coenzyme A ligase PaaK-like adenylate-forming protein